MYLLLCGSIRVPVVVVALAVLARTMVAAEQARVPVRKRLSRGMRQYSNLVNGRP
jgi:hypothetical protein